MPLLGSCCFYYTPLLGGVPITHHSMHWTLVSPSRPSADAFIDATAVYHLLRPPTNAFSVCFSSLPAITTSKASGSNWNLKGEVYHRQ